MNRIGKITKRIILAYDSDEAGVKAVKRAAELAISLGMDVKVADLPEGLDPADLISGKGNDAWRDAIKNSKHFKLPRESSSKYMIMYSITLSWKDSYSIALATVYA